MYRPPLLRCRCWSLSLSLSLSVLVSLSSSAAPLYYYYCSPISDKRSQKSTSTSNLSSGWGRQCYDARDIRLRAGSYLRTWRSERFDNLSEEPSQFLCWHHTWRGEGEGSDNVPPVLSINLPVPARGTEPGRVTQPAVSICAHGFLCASLLVGASPRPDLRVCLKSTLKRTPLFSFPPLLTPASPVPPHPPPARRLACSCDACTQMPHMRLEEQASGARRYQDVERGGSVQVSGGAPVQVGF